MEPDGRPASADEPQRRRELDGPGEANRCSALRGAHHRIDDFTLGSASGTDYLNPQVGAVPEPASYSLMLMGAAVLVAALVPVLMAVLRRALVKR